MEILKQNLFQSYYRNFIMKSPPRINNFLECINCLNQVQFFFSVNCIRKTGLKYKSTRLSKLCNVFWMVSTILLLFGGIGLKLSLSPNSRELSPILILVGFMELSLVCMTTLSNCISMMSFRDEQIDLINKIEAMDQILKREFDCQMNYEKVTRKNNLVWRLYGVYYCITCGCCVIPLVESDYLLVIIAMLCYIYLAMGSFIGGCAHTNYANIIRNRFGMICKSLDSDYLIAKFPDVTERNNKINTLLQMHKDLFKRIECINTIFGTYLNTALLHAFIQIVGNLYIIIAIHNEAQPLMFIGFLLPPIHGMIAIPWFSAAAMDEVSFLWLKLLKWCLVIRGFYEELTGENTAIADIQALVSAQITAICDECDPH